MAWKGERRFGCAVLVQGGGSDGCVRGVWKGSVEGVMNQRRGREGKGSWMEIMSLGRRKEESNQGGWRTERWKGRQFVKHINRHDHAKDGDSFLEAFRIDQ
jgi:hypothetical protein